MPEILRPNKFNIERAAHALKNGSLIGLPTETVYGLAADAENEKSVKRIFEVKGRPSNHPVIVHIGAIDYIEKWAIDIPEYAKKLANAFWPGPMTLILKRSKLAKDCVTGGQESIGLRIPKNQVALSIINEFHKIGGNGVAAPSANKFGAVSPTDALSVVEELGMKLNINEDLIIDDGPSDIGIESTIIHCLSSEPEILRPGAITKSQVFQVLKREINKQITSLEIRFSGNLKNHYSPKAKIVIEGEPVSGDGYLAISSLETPEGCIRIASPMNSYEFAKNLYSSFRKADQLGLRRLFIVPPIGDGIEIAILERITKASAD